MRRALLVATALLLSACAVADGPSSRLQVFAASSLTEVLPRIDDQPRYQFAGSDELALQIREGADADVFAAASQTHPLELFEEGLVAKPVVFATNELVLIVPRGNPADVGSVDDLRKPDVRFVIGAEEVPIGDYTRSALANLGAEDLLDHAASEEQDVRGIITKVALGEADAGFVYATDVRSAGDDITWIPLPEGAQPGITYMVAVVADAAHPVAARDFLADLLSPRGRALLGAAGFGVP